MLQEWTKDRLKESEFVNQLRARVDVWRQLGYPHVTGTTRRLLAYWVDDGTRRSVDWHEFTTHSAAFYAAYFRSKGRGTTPQQRALDAAARASAAYRETVGTAAPFSADC